MMKTVTALAGACLLAASTALYAQSPQSSPQPRERRFDCSQAKDPKACEQRVAKAKAAHAKARQACEGKQGSEQRDCMRRQMCAQSQDPAKCEARMKERVAQRAKVREACKDKTGDELKSCIREQRQKNRPKPQS